MTTDHVDIAIVGAGPVGLALAAMLVARGVSASGIVLIDAKTPEAAQLDPRSIALSYGSRQLLEQIHAWPSSATPISEIHISRRGSFGRTLIESSEYDLPALGYVCRYGQLVLALNDSLKASGVRLLRPATVNAINESAHSVTLQMADGSVLEAGLMVQAEGGVYGTQSQKLFNRDYQQSAIVATVHSSAPLAGRAFERFTDAGPLALLPQGDGYSLVWCARPARIDSLLALSDSDFLKALQEAFGQRVGNFTQVGARNSYPLGLNANPAATARTVAIGNAAQTLHPVAGQGLNLGLRDAAVLASLLESLAASLVANSLTTANAPQKLAQFVALRGSDRHITLRLTDLMARAFASTPDHSFTQGLLGLSLGLVDVLPRLKRGLADQMMFGWR